MAKPELILMHKVLLLGAGASRGTLKEKVQPRRNSEDT